MAYVCWFKCIKMGITAEISPVNKYAPARFSLSVEMMNRLTRDGTAKRVSRDQILRHERRQGNINFSCCSADHEQDWQPYPVGPYVTMYNDHTYRGFFVKI